MIIPARPITPSDDVIAAKVQYAKQSSLALLYGDVRFPLVLCDKRGFVQGYYPESRGVTMGMRAFMESYAN